MCRRRAKLARGLSIAMAVIAPLVLTHAAPAAADGTEILSKIDELREGAARARGPEAYVALRRLWREWDQGDPTAVEEAIDEVASDTPTPGFSKHTLAAAGETSTAPGRGSPPSASFAAGC
jgi:hypothetical protein